MPALTFLVPPLPIGLRHWLSEYTEYVTLPVVLATFGPASTAESLTAVPPGTLIAVPVVPPPLREVVIVVLPTPGGGENPLQIFTMLSSDPLVPSGKFVPFWVR